MLGNLWLVLALFTSLVAALQLEVPAFERPEPVCIRDFVTRDHLVVVNVKTSGSSHDGQKLVMTVIDSMGNQYAKKNNVYKDLKVSFTPHDSAAIDICFTNYLEQTGKRAYMAREIELDVESGAAARDWSALQAAEKLKPAEVDLVRVKEMTAEIVQELAYLKAREERMRDTNESTNSRVKWFSTLVIFALIGLGVWQIQYLRHYFKVKHII